MAHLFSSRNRGVVVVRKVNGSPGVITFLSDFPQTESVIITAIGYSQAVNAQFLPSLADLVYLYVFGDKMGRVEVSGICFDHTCSDSTAMQGVNRTLSYYRDNRAAVKNQAVKVKLGNNEINGFIIDLSVTTREASYKTMDFRLNIAALPRSADQSTIDAAAKEQARKDIEAEATRDSRVRQGIREALASRQHGTIPSDRNLDKIIHSNREPNLQEQLEQQTFMPNLVENLHSSNPEVKAYARQMYDQYLRVKIPEIQRG